MRHWRFWIITAAVVAAVGGGAWYVIGWRTLSVVQPRIGPAVEAVYATGTVEPRVSARISPHTTGRIVAMAVEEGELVEKGQVLARLENRVAAARVRELEARAQYLKAEADRAGELFQRRTISQQARDLAASEWNVAEAALAVARAQLDELTLTAPFDGGVIRRDGEVGEVVTPSDVVYWIGCCSPLRIEAEVDEEDIPQVSVGQTALIRTDAFPDQVFRGRVDEITPRGDPIARSYRVRVALPPDAPLLIGMTAEVNIIVRSEDEALLVPAAALDGRRVWLVEDGRLRVQPVEVGVIVDTLAEIRSGVEPRDLIVLDPPEGLDPGDWVRTRRVTPAGAL